MDSNHRPGAYKASALSLSYNSILFCFIFGRQKTAIPFLPALRGLLERDAKATRTPETTGRA